jgi:hypothetical protein
MSRTKTLPPAAPVQVSPPTSSPAGISEPSWQVSAGAVSSDSAPARVHARDVPDEVEKIRAAAAANPDAEFEITWRIVTR